MNKGQSKDDVPFLNFAYINFVIHLHLEKQRTNGSPIYKINNVENVKSSHSYSDVNSLCISKKEKNAKFLQIICLDYIHENPATFVFTQSFPSRPSRLEVLIMICWTSLHVSLGLKTTNFEK